MLFYEPYTGLDQDASSLLDDILNTLARQGRTVVMTSHDLARVEDLATRFDILSRGVIAATATQRQLKRTDLLTFYKQALVAYSHLRAFTWMLIPPPLHPSFKQFLPLYGKTCAQSFVHSSWCHRCWYSRCL